MTARKQFTRRQWLAAGRRCELLQSQELPDVYPYSELHVDPANGSLSTLTRRELALLAYLAAEGAPVN